MPVYKDKNGTWYAMVRYEDWQGERKQKCKRGFVTKREAQNWERRFLLQANSDLDMLFKDFYKLYEQDMRSRLKQNTWEHKAHVIQSKILPYFGDKPMKNIQARDVLSWQNELLRHRDKNGKPYSETYLKNLHNQLSCIFNHAVRYYDLGVNPAAKAGSIGVKNAKEMNFWTKDEYMQFSEVMMDKPVSFYAFEMLYWCGIRLGDDDDKIRLNQRKPSKYKGLSRFGPEKNLQRINKFMKERPTFYKKLIQMKENFRFYLRCFYCITKVVILQFNSEKQDRISS